VEFPLTALIFLTSLVYILDEIRIFCHCLTVPQVARTGAQYTIGQGAQST